MLSAGSQRAILSSNSATMAASRIENKGRKEFVVPESLLPLKLALTQFLMSKGIEETAFRFSDADEETQILMVASTADADSKERPSEWIRSTVWGIASGVLTL